MKFLLTLLLSFCLLAELSAGVSTFLFIDESDPGSGFSATASRQPLDGNTGTTLGEQRRLVFERAGEIWGQFLVSPIPIQVSVQYAPLGSGALAAAGPSSLERDFPNALEGNTYYPVALANSLAGYDLRPGQMDINITVSSDSSFYLGFGQNSPAGSANLLDVILHELGHGLGFISLVNSSGAFFDNRPDVFTRRIFDLQQNLGWSEMSSSERFISRTNDPFVVWTGEFTTTGSSFVLDSGGVGEAQAVITQPLAVANYLRMTRAAFGPGFPSVPIEASLVLAKDGSEALGKASIACSSLTNAGEIDGKIVLIRRGECFFDEKVFRAQQAGAVAVIVANNAGDDLVTMGPMEDGPSGSITIPALFIGEADGDALEAASPGVVIRLERPPGFSGSNDERLRLHAPATFSSGSSVSHWTTAASPNLLMEPIINSNLDRRLDLTLTQMRDIGWRVVDIPFPHLTYELWAAENLSPTITARQPLDDPGARGVTNLERYVFGLPESATQIQLPVLSFAGEVVQLRYTRSTMPADIEVGYEISHDLITFQSAVEGVDFLEELITPLGGSVEEVTLTLLVPPSLRLFLRLRLSIP